ncbi:DUF1538 domain-containing protein [Anaerobium acetethylicum]|uniref:DUF1538 domain-containing protein n=1 Tax=Anaerobium acetethylicum TaxID=1619234 RepID=A0A1D3TVQ7_9FIRM|nr:DUF1538 domain-containing protein [Anaerobium acetethylicum]SCP98234.1 Protein of unknown function [Anaerobium acetethylicum]
MNIIVSKLKEVAFSVLPITLMVIGLNLTLTPLEGTLIARFLIGTAVIILGLSLFLFGVEISITQIGNEMGSAIAKSNQLPIVVGAGLVLGFFISVAEPDLHILAGQVEAITSGTVAKFGLVAVVSVGIALLIAGGLVRIVYNIPLYKVLTVLYGIIFILGVFTSREFLAISFDASGATTGALTVPFILALAAGAAELKKDSKASEKDSFGLVGIASVGAIMAVMVMSLAFRNEEITGKLEYEEVVTNSIAGHYLQKLPVIAGEVLIALLPILLIFAVFQIASLKLPGKIIKRILFGILLTYAGLVLFLTGVNAGFMDVGTMVGYRLASLENKAYLVVAGFLMGFVTILAEPAVHILTRQIEDVTSGYIRKKAVLSALSIGIGSAIALSMVRILIPGVQLAHFLVPGYILAITLTFLAPKIFVGIAFDAGGVASGPMTATFILAFAHGAADATEGADIVADGFGLIAMVALMPLITLQVLGLIFKMKSKKRGNGRS